MTSDIDSLISENKKLREYVSLISAELELSQRVCEIRQNFANSADSEHIIRPILERITRIQSEKLSLQNLLRLD